MVELRCYSLKGFLLLLLLGTLTFGHVWNRTYSPFYEVIIPQQLEHTGSQGYKSQVSYMMDIGGERYVIHLRQKRIFIAATFPVYTYSGSAMFHMEEPHIQDDCYYHGYVEGFTDSVVGISTCYGLSGFLQFRNLSYGIEPLESSIDFQHLVYQIEYSEDLYSESTSCGMNYANQNMHSKGVLHDPQFQEIYTSPQTQYVESFVVVSKGQFDYLRKNETAVIEEVISVINQADAMYESLNVHLMLVGIEIWTADNLVSISHSAEDILNNFADWKMASLNPRLTYDNAALILRETVLPTVGLAFDSKICQPEKSAFFAVFKGNQTARSAVIFAHELGHCLGMRHDDSSNCNCGSNNCLMAPNSISSFAFSDCSIADMADFKDSGGTQCLLNIPGTAAIAISTCGNKIVEGTEQCDCGNKEECKMNPCCTFETCTLTLGSVCAHGRCCVNCKFATAGLTCRPSTNECDLPEFCDGRSENCRNNTFKQKGTPCNNNNGYCYRGLCQYHDGQCQDIFGSGTKSAEFICYEEANMQGDRFGNCGWEDDKFIQCNPENALCGKIQCKHPITAPTYVGNASIIYYAPKGSICKTLNFPRPINIVDETWVHDGTKCGADKLCLDHRCVSVSNLDVACDPKKHCNGHGACNNVGQCHCDIGWTPPDCSHKGLARRLGDMHTTPIYDNSKRNWLLVGVGLLVLHIAIIIIAIIIKRRQSTENNERQDSQAYETENGGQPQTTSQSEQTSAFSSNPSA
uniref:Disintegrin and metalloproteinase domain-containing protein 9-like isoform X2 n=1 Tax=Geotrypetes seraphini TaxID=260995 RepID=A0A6P8R159_GEOSA|nr:disintegrin and metalloproteinase domain-containing protein 9-like isoform X2 [Geotrypetes seraphini]